MTTTQRAILILLAIIIFFISQNWLSNSGKQMTYNEYGIRLFLGYPVRLISVLLPGWLIYKAAGANKK